MIWHNLDELQAYHVNTDGRCYCELLLNPNDLVLQAHLPPVSSGNVFRASIYSADGGTKFNDFNVYGVQVVSTDTNGDFYTTLRLESFPPFICTGFYNGQRCFTVRLEVFQTIGGVTSTLFDKFTQPYCIADCCSTNIEVEVGTGNDVQKFKESTYYEGTPTHCGNPLVRIVTAYDCYDADGNYYGLPVKLIDNKDNTDVTYIPFSQITNIQGLFKALPADIKVITARNCKTQKTESANPWMLQCRDHVPAWKMRDLENQFRASTILIDGNQYNFPGGTMFEKIKNYQKDWRAEYYWLNTIVQECRIWNIFGCGTCEVAKNTLRVIAVPASGGEVFKVFNESGVPIANDIDDWEVYLSSMDGVIAVSDVSYIYSTLGYATAFLIESDGYIPPYFYCIERGSNMIYAP